MALADIKNIIHNFAEEAKGSFKSKNKSFAKTTKRTRERSPDSGTENELINILTPQKKMKKPNCVRGKEMQAYFRLLEDPHINDFLSCDGCKLISDKYLLAMVFAYFKRADLPIRQYTRLNFFLALYLANDVEEDEEEYKYEILPWALGHTWRNKYMNFLRKRDKLWTSIGYRAIVSQKCCEEVMSIEPDHWAWHRDRLDHHAGAIRGYLKEDEDDGLPRGPDATPRLCNQCALFVEYDSVSPSSTSWYLSSSSESSPEGVFVTGAGKVRSVRCVPGNLASPAGFDMEGLKETLQESDDVSTLNDPDNIWVHGKEDEEE